MGQQFAEAEQAEIPGWLGVQLRYVAGL